MKKTIFNKCWKKDLYNITLLSAYAKNKKVYIFEKWDMSDFLSIEESEFLRQKFLDNNIIVKQITNNYKFNKFTKNSKFINNVMQFRYISKDIFKINYEILIFDNITAIYNKKEILIIENNLYTENQKQLFFAIWEQWISPKLWFNYKPNHSYCKSIDLFFRNIQIIVWPEVDTKIIYKNFLKKDLEKLIFNIIESDFYYYKNSSYIICFLWNYNWNKMVDMWKFNENIVDNHSWPLSNLKVYKNWKICMNLWVASWNTLLVLWAEENLEDNQKI